MIKDITKESIGMDANNNPLYLSDIWPTTDEIKQLLNSCLKKKMFEDRYKNVFDGPEEWSNIETKKGLTYNWDISSTYVRYPPYFENMNMELEDLKEIEKARVLALLGDSITTDHISPAGVIKNDGPAAKYLLTHQVSENNFNSYGSRRGNHEVMMRGTFGNIRIRNKMVPEKEGGYTKFIPDNKIMSIYDAAMLYKNSNIPLVVVAGKEYGTGSSRDWAAKGTALLGVRLVLAESFERIHRSNLIGMGILPVEFTNEESAKILEMKGSELITVKNLKDTLKPGATLNLEIQYENKKIINIQVLCRIDTSNELEYYKNGGILHYVIRKLVKGVA